MPKPQDFASLLEQSSGAAPDRTSRRLKPGDIVEVTVIGVTDDTVFVDAGTPGDGRIPRSDFTDPGTNLRLAVGARLRAMVRDPRADGPLFGAVVRAERLGLDELEAFRDSRMPVEGRVTRATRGGLELSVGGHRAFCPLSQLPLDHGTELESYVKTEFAVLILEIKEQGRSLIVSRRAYLDAVGHTTDRGETSQAALDSEPKDSPAISRDEVVHAKVKSHKRSGLVVSTSLGEGFVHLRELDLAPGADLRRTFPIGHELPVVFLALDDSGRARYSARRVRDVEERKNFEEYAETSASSAAALGSFGELLREKLGLDPAPEPATPPVPTQPELAPKPTLSQTQEPSFAATPPGPEPREVEVKSRSGSVVRHRRR